MLYTDICWKWRATETAGNVQVFTENVLAYDCTNVKTFSVKNNENKSMIIIIIIVFSTL